MVQNEKPSTEKNLHDTPQLINGRPLKSQNTWKKYRYLGKYCSLISVEHTPKDQTLETAFRASLKNLFLYRYCTPVLASNSDEIF